MKPNAVGAYPWVPDQGDGTYRNPILFADYSDPDVVRVGDDFYLTASSFNCTPGLPILHSRDLVNWTIVNHAIQQVPDPRYAQVQHGQGVWAPAIRHHDGKFWIFFPTPDEGIYVTTATDPAGRWSQPHLLLAGKGFIDPCPLWDDEGKAYLVHAFAKSRCGLSDQLRICPMSPDATRTLGEGQIAFHDPQRHPWMEGPKFLKKDGWYYIFAPAGGVATGWQVAMRSRSVYGPYEDKIVLEQGPTAVNGPHQGALVDLPNGEWWFIHFQERQPYGRIVHLQPVTWKDGWPIIGIDQDGNGIGEPVLHHRKPGVKRTERILVPATSDEFDNLELGLQWQWHANHNPEWYSLSKRKGWLRLYAQHVETHDLRSVPNILAQKLPAESFAVDTRIEPSLKPGEQVGLIVTGLEHVAALMLRQTESGRLIVYLVDGKEAHARGWPHDSVNLQVTMGGGGVCTFSYGPNAEPLRSLEPPFQAVPGRWIGAKIGVFATATEQRNELGYADFAHFRFSRNR